MSLLETLINNQHQFTICSEDMIPDHKEILSRYPIDLVDVNPKRVNNSLNNIKTKPNMFIFDSVDSERQYSAYLYNKWNQCPRIIDINSLPKLEKWRKAHYQGLVSNILIPQNTQMAPANF